MLSETTSALFGAPNMVHLAVTDGQGHPHSTPVWAMVNDHGQVVVNTAIGRFKDRHLQVGDAVALSVLDPQNPYQYAQVRGTVVERTTDDGDQIIDALAKAYLNADSYPFRQEGEQRVTVRIQPSQVTGVGA